MWKFLESIYFSFICLVLVHQFRSIFTKPCDIENSVKICIFALFVRRIPVSLKTSEMDTNIPRGLIEC